MFARSISLSRFPVYLLPSIPFRRSKNGTEAAEAATSTHADRISSVNHHLNGHTSRLRCAKCATDICFTSQIVSKGFTGRHGRAYLVSPTTSINVPQNLKTNKTLSLPNTRTDAPSQRQLVTGAHTVSDVRCAFCASMLGWKYDAAEEESQRYKVGKYILETKMICTSNDWEYQDLRLPSKDAHSKDEECGVDFDSQDEDECEDMFAGIWNPQLAMKRRDNKAFGRERLAGANRK